MSDGTLLTGWEGNFPAGPARGLKRIEMTLKRRKRKVKQDPKVSMMVIYRGYSASAAANKLGLPKRPSKRNQMKLEL